MTTAPALQTLARLPGFKSAGKDKWACRCPGHEDRVASLSIGQGSDGRVLLHCHAGCELPRILEAAGIDAKDLFPSNGNGHQPARQIVATYDYHTASGELSYQVVRFEPKDFRQRRPDGKGGWIPDTKGLKRLPYNLPELAGAQYPFIPEGEKDVDELRRIGLTATCNSGGAGKWTAELAQYFRPDQHVTILPDNDEPGRKHARQVAEALHGKVASLKILELAGLPEKGDISDWLIGRDPEAAAEELSRLSDAAPEWKPAEKEPDKPANPFTPPAHWIMRDAADVASWPCAPIQWVIEGIAARGNLVWVAADSQTGKTLVGLYNALQMIRGGLLYGQFPVTPVNRILYLVLEDPDRRIKERILDMLRAGDPPIPRNRFTVYFAAGLNIGDELQAAWLEGMLIGFDVVYLDTYQRATPGIASFDDAKQSLIVHRLMELTRKHNILLWVHDHFRKTDQKNKRKDPDKSDIKGTGGKVQNADCVISMDKQGDRIRVKVETKEDSNVRYFMLRVSPKGSPDDKFTYMGDLEQMGGDMKALGEANRKKVLEAVPDDGREVSRNDICEATGLQDNAVKNHLRALIAEAGLKTNGKKGKAIRYMRANGIGREETPPRPNGASQEFTLS